MTAPSVSLAAAAQERAELISAIRSAASMADFPDPSGGQIARDISIEVSIGTNELVGYATAKAGMLGLTRATAVDAAGHGITVNAVAPGWIATGSQTPDERLQGLASPIGRSGTPGEVAAAIAWLASPAWA